MNGEYFLRAKMSVTKKDKPEPPAEDESYADLPSKSITLKSGTTLTSGKPCLAASFQVTSASTLWMDQCKGRLLQGTYLRGKKNFWSTVDGTNIAAVVV